MEQSCSSVRAGDAAQGRIAGGEGIARGDAPVVGGEADDRIVGEAELVEFLEHQADGVVHGLDHTGIDRAVLHLAHTEATIEKKTFLGQACGCCLCLLYTSPSPRDRG